MKPYLRNIRILWLGLTALMAFFVVYSITVPNGNITYTQNFQNDNYHRIDKLKPIERTLPVSSIGQTILGGPVYFKLNTPRKFDQAKVKVVYRTNPNFKHSQIELGLLMNKQQWQYQLKPLENKVIEQTQKNWSMIKKGDEILLQRNHTYDSIADFKKQPPYFEKLAVYNDNLKIDRNSSSSEEGSTEIAVPLVGSYQFYVQTRASMTAEFSFKNEQAENIKKQAELLIYDGDNLQMIIDLSKDRSTAEQWSYSLKLDKPKEGYYKVEFRADDNVISRGLKIDQKQVSFLGKLKFAKDSKPSQLWTDSREVSFLAKTSEAVGDVYINNQRQRVSEVYRQFGYDTKSRISELQLETPGLELTGDGVFAFSSSTIFDPRIKRVDYLTDLDREGTDFILARYKAVSRDRGWTTATANFNLSGAELSQKSYDFMLSVPGFKNDDQVSDWMEIKEIQVELTGKTLKERLENFIKRVALKLFLS